MSGGFAIVIVEKSTKAGLCFDYAITFSHVLVCMDDTTTQSLMVSFKVVVLHVLFDRQMKVLLSKGNDFVRTLRA